jgi:hypothetical protein
MELSCRVHKSGCGPLVIQRLLPNTISSVSILLGQAFYDKGAEPGKTCSGRMFGHFLETWGAKKYVTTHCVLASAVVGHWGKNAKGRTEAGKIVPCTNWQS